MTPDTVLGFWFGTERPRTQRREWFAKDEVFDATISARFGPTIQAALHGDFDHWQVEPASALARIVVLDQFTRNTARGSAAAFAGDALALAGAQRMVNQGQDLTLDPIERAFVYLPFEHAEAMSAQDESIRLFTRLAEVAPGQAGQLDWAHKHRAIVERFGRFPHRNAALGRTSTPVELLFLQGPGSSF